MKLILIALGLMLIGWQCGQAQTINNPGFESGNLGEWQSTNPAYYDYAKEPGYLVSVSKDAHRGFVASMTSFDQRQWGQQLLVYKPTDSLEVLRLSGYLKLTHVKAGSAGISVRILGNGSDLSSAGKSLKEITPWTKIYTDFEVLLQTDSLLLFCSISGSGQVFFDQIQLERINPSNTKQSSQAKVFLDTALAIIRRRPGVMIAGLGPDPGDGCLNVAFTKKSVFALTNVVDIKR